MSRHTFETTTFNVCLGVDRPLTHVFAQVFLNNPPEDAATDEAPGFSAFSHYPLSTEGVMLAIDDVGRFIRKTEKYFQVPMSIQTILIEDIQRYLDNVDLNYQSNHGFVPTSRINSNAD